MKTGATENARPDIARLDNAAPYRKGGHRETCFSVRVYAHYKFMFDSGSIIWAAHPFYVCSSVSFCFTYCYVRQTKLASSLDNIWAHYKILIVCVWFLNVFCHHCVLNTVYVFYVRTAPVQSQHMAPRCTFCNSRPRLLPRLPLPIPTPLKFALLAQAPACSRLRPRCCCCCCCCRPAAVVTGWLHAETAGDYKRRCRIVTSRI